MGANNEAIRGHLEYGVRQGWWPDYDKDRLEPNPWPWNYVISSRQLSREYLHPEWGMKFWKHEATLPENTKFISQVLVAMKIFPSVGEAKRAGYGIPLDNIQDPSGLGVHFWFKKRTVHLIVDLD